MISRAIADRLQDRVLEASMTKAASTAMNRVIRFEISRCVKVIFPRP